MGYYTALNSSWTFVIENGKKVMRFYYENRLLIVYEYGGRYYLYKDKYQLSEIVSGKEGFIKQYKGDYKKWAEKVEKKDMDKVKKLRAMAEKVITDANEIEKIWE